MTYLPTVLPNNIQINRWLTSQTLCFLNKMALRPVLSVGHSTVAMQASQSHRSLHCKCALGCLFRFLICVFLNVFSMYCQWPRVELYLEKYHWGAMSSILYFSTDILSLNQFWRSLFTVDFLLFLKCVALIILKLVLVRTRYELIFFTSRFLLLLSDRGLMYLTREILSSKYFPSFWFLLGQFVERPSCRAAGMWLSPV